MDSPASSSHNASDRYVYRVPSPPRIFVPPPYQTSIDSPLSTTATDIFLQPSWPFTQYAFLSSANVKHPRARDLIIDWTYGERQKAQEILPYLFLGPYAAARDKAFLESKKITMVLGVRKVMDGIMLNPRAPRDLQLEMEFVDINTEGDLIKSFSKLTSMINNHLESKYLAAKVNPALSSGRVLVFCESGNERSATAVAAYIISVYNLNLVEAIRVIQGQRFCVNIDDDSRTRLDTYGHILRAERDVLEADHGVHETGQMINDHMSAPQPSFPRKRTIEQIAEDDEDETMLDINTSQKRDGYAPFSDEIPED